MFWITPKIYCGDAWFRSLGPEGIIVFGLCTSFTTLRTDLPGLLNTTPVALAEQLPNLTLDFIKLGLMQLCLPDKHGSQHFFFDADARVIRIPHLPLHQKAANENVIRGWFRRWRDIPDCRLKFDHIESLALAIKVPEHERVWAETFGNQPRYHGPGYHPSVSKHMASVTPPTPSVSEHTPSVTPPTVSDSVSDPVSDPVCVSDSVSVSVSVGGVTHAEHTNILKFPSRADSEVTHPPTRPGLGEVNHGTRPAKLRELGLGDKYVPGQGYEEPQTEESLGGKPRDITKPFLTPSGLYLPPGFE
jgi:hypothetical protein